MASIQHEQQFWKRGQLVAGVDEAGRGCLAGPVVAAAVVLDPLDRELADAVADSKTLRASVRLKLYKSIIQRAYSWGVGIVDVPTIEQYNILRATMLAMAQSVNALRCTISCVLVDGPTAPMLTQPTLTLVGGDKRSASIAAASIIAKVTRDQLMIELAHQYPNYGLERHKGYPTSQHFAALEQWGPSPVHRASFLRKWRNSQQQFRAM